MKKKIALPVLGLCLFTTLLILFLPRVFTPDTIKTIIREIETMEAPEGKVLKDLVYKQKFPGRSYSLDIYYPLIKASKLYPEYETELAPVLVFIHGGSWLHGDKSMIRVIDPFLTAIRKNGIAVVAVNYTSGITGGLRMPVENCRDALTWIADYGQEYGLNPEKTGLYGVSAGAHLAMMALPEISKNDNITILYLLEEFGPVDLKAMAAGDAFDASGIFKLFREKTLEKYSPILYVDKEWPPVLMLHGTADRTVSIHQTELLAARLEKEGVPHSFKVVPEGDHGFFNMPRSYWRELEALCLDFILPLIYPEDAI